MTGREYFLRIRAKIDERESLKRLIDELLADASAVGGFDYSKPIVQSSPKNVMEMKIIELADTIEYYEKVVKKCSDEIIEAEERLSELSRPEYAEAIRYRFIYRKRRGWIADEMGYSEKHIERCIYKGLTEFERRWLGETVDHCPSI